MEDRQLELLMCAFHGHLLKVQELLATESGLVSVHSRTPKGQTVLHIAALGGRLTTIQWLLEFGGSDITERDFVGMDVWELLARHLLCGVLLVRDATAVTALLRVMALQGAPFPELVAELSPEGAQVIHDGEFNGYVHGSRRTSCSDGPFSTCTARCL
jgi:ankyrin repeat protein